MIRIYLGRLGSAKTVSTVRELSKDRSGRTTYTNINVKGIRNIKKIKGTDIIKKTLVSVKKKRDGTTEEVFKIEFNIDFWLKQKKPLNIVWDEIHFVANSRESQSKLNRVMGKFLSMGRRITGFDKKGYGHFIFIAQTSRTIDVNIKDLCNEIRYHILHWIIICINCNRQLWINSEMKEIEFCQFCGSWDLERTNFKVQIFRFHTWVDYLRWEEGWGKYYFEKYWITDIEEYFSFYDTHQIENIFEDFS